MFVTRESSSIFVGDRDPSLTGIGDMMRCKVVKVSSVIITKIKSSWNSKQRTRSKTRKHAILVKVCLCSMFVCLVPRFRYHSLSHHRKQGSMSTTRVPHSTTSKHGPLILRRMNDD